MDADRLHELRQGFVNNNGAMGALRRNEDDTVTSGDVYAEARWNALPALSVTLGVRSSHVHYESVDHYIVGANPDDSGSRDVLQHESRSPASSGMPPTISTST